MTMVLIRLNVLLLLLLFESGYSTVLKCNPNDNCLCFHHDSDFEFQCPQNYYEEGGFVIHLSETDMLIDCYFNNKPFDITLLPNITLTGIKNFRMRFCPIPEAGFKQVVDWFSLEEVKSFQFSNANLTNATLTKDYFEGMRYLQHLSLDTNVLSDVDEDLFVNTPNLISLDFKANTLKLTPGLFRNTPKLQWLDLAQNELEDIPEDIFEPLDKLEVLHLWGNKCIKLENRTFSGLKNLKLLELSANNIAAVDEDAFVELGNLKEINLSKNKLTSLAPNTFTGNKNLELISLNYNQNFTLSDYLFSNLTLLNEIDLGNCRIKSIPVNIFEHSVNIKRIKLQHNNLTRIPKGLFKQLSHLEEINLSANKIASIEDEFWSLKLLKVLLLQNNAINEISRNVFKDLHSLETINLQQNKIKTINHAAFDSNKKLKIINLSHNQYSNDLSSFFVLLDNVLHAETIDLSYNLITQIEAVVSVINKINLSKLDLSHNRITSVLLQDLQPLNMKLDINLENNNITTINFGHVELIATAGDKTDIFSTNNPLKVVLRLGHNPLKCDCTNYDLVKYLSDQLAPEVKVMYDIKTNNLSCAMPLELKGTPVKDVPPQLWICSLDELLVNNTVCPMNCSCHWRPMDTTIIINCSNKEFVEFPSINLDQISSKRFSQLEMHFENNRLTTGPSSNLSSYENATSLYLSHNQIDTLTWLPSNIRVLHLDYNNLTHLDDEVLETLNTSYLVNLTLNDNPWSCDCDAFKFTRFLRSKQIESKNIFCAESTKLLIEQDRSNLCSEWQLVYSVLIVVTFLLMIAIAFSFYYYKKQEIKVWLYAHNLCLWWVTEEELDKDKIYDAFISYSHKDEEFVVQNLLPVLEGGPNPYKLCLHYRNWVPGEFITTQVTNSVLESRRTLVVLSPNFLESVWGKMEFRTAHTHAMTEGLARVIIVLYGDVDVDKLDDELKSYMKTNTYVKWGDPYFWNKLKYALPHSKNVPNNKQKIANVMNCIDDKFNLVTPIKSTSSPGTTPPALDSGKLKKHPLNFTAIESETPPAESGNMLIITGL